MSLSWLGQKHPVSGTFVRTAFSKVRWNPKAQSLLRRPGAWNNNITACLGSIRNHRITLITLFAFTDFASNCPIKLSLSLTQGNHKELGVSKRPLGRGYIIWLGGWGSGGGRYSDDTHLDSVSLGNIFGDILLNNISKTKLMFKEERQTFHDPLGPVQELSEQLLCLKL